MTEKRTEKKDLHSESAEKYKKLLIRSEQFYSCICCAGSFGIQKVQINLGIHLIRFSARMVANKQGNKLSMFEQINYMWLNKHTSNLNLIKQPINEVIMIQTGKNKRIQQKNYHIMCKMHVQKSSEERKRMSSCTCYKCRTAIDFVMQEEASSS